MLTVLEAINKSTGYLKNKGVESPRVNAELLLSHILKCKRLNLYLSFDRPLSEDEIYEYRELLKRRGKNEPLQYIVGNVDFYGINLEVNSNVLIPRPETEILVETIIEELKEKENPLVLDIGTGSGNIVIALAANLVNAELTAIDISEEALNLAKKNAELNNVNDKIKFQKVDFLNDDVINNKFDVIVSNPPYISIEEFHDLRPELNKFEPRFALTDESDGLIFYKAISRKSKNLLRQKGKLYFELGIGKSAEVEKIMSDDGYNNILIKKDYSNIERVIFGELN